MYLIRLDDASEYMDVDKWDRMEQVLDKYSINPIVGIIPNNEDEKLISNNKYDPNFWHKARIWQEKGWIIALHGYTHVYISNSGGLNPVNLRSEFAGVSLDKQKDKIKSGMNVFRRHGLKTKVFFAPSHTFDLNTLKALKEESSIRIISDTIANDIYRWGGFHFIPQQSGRVRNLPFKVTTFCYHPNNMNEHDFILLERFIKKHRNKFIGFQNLKFSNKSLGLYDKMLRKMYFLIKYVRSLIRGR